MTGPVLVTGVAGLLGSALIAAAPAGVEVHATERTHPSSARHRHHVDLADAESVDALFASLRPSVVIHAAVGTEDGERDIVRASRTVAEACARTGAALVHVSTDQVLDGEHAPYAEDAEPAPVLDYGRWKADAEGAVAAIVPDAAICRTSLIVRANPMDHITRDTVDTLRRGERLERFVDELRSPIAADDLAAQLWEVAALPAEARRGVWHLAGPEAVSRYTLAVLVALRFGCDASLVVPTLSRTSPHPRPRDLRLLTPRADAALRTRPRPVSQVLAAAVETAGDSR